MGVCTKERKGVAAEVLMSHGLKILPLDNDLFTTIDLLSLTDC